MQLRFGLGEIRAGVADRVVARLLRQPVHQRGALRKDCLGYGLGIRGREGIGTHMDDAAARLVAHVHHAPPVGKQILNRCFSAQGEYRVALGTVVERTQVEIAVDCRDDLLAPDELEQDVGIRRSP